ncbi:hypothetical protein EUTSA_v10029270mg [Eutrema salsugineum]|uniref:DUF4378 domain-containing protein n=1 Tax=Eutrema salsugineum TaxID=72664 RepID=V4MYR5_EUTSA|nr:uncharacterized protein LOC18014769 [Eutrema salsugineum]ESQ37726.1 hypothetical protein EUTSA_v10029270mg [Eutrema salsugineum]
MELRPRMLKDCLLEDSNSCSSNGFKSIPRRPTLNQFPLIPTKRKESNALQALINVVKNLRSNAVKSTPSGLLPRSLSRRLSSKNKAVENKAIITVVRVKDIVRWSSSKDLHEEDISHFEPSPPRQYTTKTITTTTTGSSTTSGTSCSSWCDSDFTSEFLPSSWGGGNVEKEGGENKLLCVGEDSCTAVTDADTEVGPQEDLQCEKEQNSPVSVLEIQHGEDSEASDSSLSQCLDNVERTKQKLMQTIQRFENLANISPFNLDEWVSMDEESCTEEGLETDIIYDDENCDTGNIEVEDEDVDEVEEKAAQLWDRVRERHAIWIHEEHLIMDYFRDELMQNTNSSHETYRDYQHFEDELVGEAKEWLQGQRVSELERGTGEQRRQACAREIERQDWNEKRMKEEREEVAVQIEDGVFSLLMKETLDAICQC